MKKYLLIIILSIISNFSFSQILEQNYKIQAKQENVIIRKYDVVEGFGNTTKEILTSITKLDYETYYELVNCIEYCRDNFSEIENIDNEIITHSKKICAFYRKINDKTKIQIVLYDSDYYENILDTRHIIMIFDCYNANDCDNILNSIKIKKIKIL